MLIMDVQVFVTRILIVCYTLIGCQSYLNRHATGGNPPGTDALIRLSRIQLNTPCGNSGSLFLRSTPRLSPARMSVKSSGNRRRSNNKKSKKQAAGRSAAGDRREPQVVSAGDSFFEDLADDDDFDEDLQFEGIDGRKHGMGQNEYVNYFTIWCSPPHASTESFA